MVGSYGVVRRGQDCGHELKAEPPGLAYGFDAGDRAKTKGAAARSGYSWILLVPGNLIPGSQR